MKTPGGCPSGFDEVLFFHADDKYTVVRTASDEHLIRTTITGLASQLDQASRLFVRIKGHAQELPVSRAFVHMLKAM